MTAICTCPQLNAMPHICKPATTFDAPNEPLKFDGGSNRTWADLHIHNLTQKHFYGKFVLIFEDGKIVRAIKEETIKP
jgi:hypothetical protein